MQKYLLFQLIVTNLKMVYKITGYDGNGTYSVKPIQGGELSTIHEDNIDHGATSMLHKRDKYFNEETGRFLSSEENKRETNVPENKAMRFNDDKLKWSLVDFESLEPLVKVLMFGAKKYSPDNWKKGLPTNEVCESLLRHVFAIMRGELFDKESGELHIGHVMANAMFISFHTPIEAKHKTEEG